MASRGAARRTFLLCAAGWFASGCGDRETDGPGAGGPPRGPTPMGSGPGPGAPEGAPEAWFAEEALARGLAFTQRSGAQPGRLLMPEIMSGGAALFDPDGDGDLDAYLVQSGPLEAPAQERAGNQLFENDGRGRFSDRSAECGADDRGYGNGVACGDVDGDGRVDLYVTNWGPNALLLNQSALGRLRFENSVATHGGADASWGTSAVYFDRDLDGDLDLYVCNYLEWSPDTEMPCVNSLGGKDYCSPQNYEAPALDVLYDNQGGRLVERGAELGITTRATGLGVVAADFDQDGWVDLLVANDGMPDLYWRNDGRGAFRDDAARVGVAFDADGVPKAGMGVAAADVDGDGDEDLIVVNLNRETDSLYINTGSYFRDATRKAGIAASSRPMTRFGVGWIDFDNDGLLDLFQACGRVQRQERSYGDDPYAEPNLLYRGVPGGRFEWLGSGQGSAPPLYAASRAAAFGDVDGDGGVDVLVVNRDGPAHLFLDRAPARGHYLRIACRGASGADVLGARVEVRHGTAKQVCWTRAGYSYQASSEPVAHFGLGATDRVQAVVVRWPDGLTEDFGPLSVDLLHTVVRGQGQSH